MRYDRQKQRIIFEIERTAEEFKWMWDFFINNGAVIRVDKNNVVTKTTVELSALQIEHLIQYTITHDDNSFNKRFFIVTLLSFQMQRDFPLEADEEDIANLAELKGLYISLSSDKSLKFSLKPVVYDPKNIKETYVRAYADLNMQIVSPHLERQDGLENLIAGLEKLNDQSFLLESCPGKIPIIMAQSVNSETTNPPTILSTSEKPIIILDREKLKAEEHDLKANIMKLIDKLIFNRKLMEDDVNLSLCNKCDQFFYALKQLISARIIPHSVVELLQDTKKLAMQLSGIQINVDAILSEKKRFTSANATYISRQLSQNDEQSNCGPELTTKASQVVQVGMFATGSDMEKQFEQANFEAIKSALQILIELNAHATDKAKIEFSTMISYIKPLVKMLISGKAYSCWKEDLQSLSNLNFAVTLAQQYVDASKTSNSLNK